MLKPDYERDGVRLYIADALTFLRDCPDMAFGAIVTDPPYNCNCKYDVHPDDMPPAEYEASCAEWFAECRRVATRTIIFPGHGNLWMWGRIAKPSGVGCWYKPGNPSGGGVFQFCEWEPWLMWGKPIGRSDVIRATITEQRGVGKHPCPKPLPLLDALMLRLKDAECICDPFMGSGTTGVAAVRHGKRFEGCDISCAYYRISKRRIDAELRQGRFEFEEARNA